MKNKFEGKKLLIMGANPETTPLVKLANDMGIKTYVASNRNFDDAKKYAYRPLDIDGLDVEGLTKAVNEHDIDGVMVGVADVLVKPYASVCARLNLPCLLTEKVADILSAKDSFREFAKPYGVNGVPDFSLSAEPTEDELSNLKFPIMIKPADGCSGMGISLCRDKADIVPAIKKALAASRKKKFIAERYMECDDMGLYYTFIGGECKASCVYDRYTSREQAGVSRVCLGGTYPSKHIDEYFAKMHDRAIRCFGEMGIRNGVLMLSAFYDGIDFYVYDVGFRLQGEAPHLLLKAAGGRDQREMLINFALTGSMGERSLLNGFDPYMGEKYGATLWFLLKAGTIKNISGLDNLERDKRIVANIQRFREGEVVLPEWIGTEKQVLTRLYILCDTKAELADTLLEYMEKVKITNEYGGDMLLRGFDVKEALQI